MSVKVAELLIDVKAETATSISALKSVSSALSNVASDALKHASSIGGAFSKLPSPIGAAKGALGGLVEGLGKVGLAASGIHTITGAIGGLGKALTGGNSQFETYGISIQTLIKNSDDFKNKYKNVTDPLELQSKAAAEAKEEMGKLAAFGASTPFDLPQVVEASTVLRGFGLAAENTKDRFGFSKDQILTITGDLASGTNTDFKEMATVLGKFSSGATGDAISRLQELGVTTKSELTKMGLNFDKGGSLVIKSQADMDKATGILLTSIKNKYGGLMDAQSSSLSGMLSNLSDWKDGVIRQVTAPLFEPIKTGLAKVLAFLGSDAGKAAVQALVDGITKGMAELQHVFNIARDGVLTFKSALSGNWSDSNSIMPIHRAIGNFGLLVRDTVIPTIKNLIKEFGPIVSTAWQVYSAISPMSIIFDSLKAILGGEGLTGVIDVFKTHFLQVLGVFFSAKDAAGIANSTFDILGNVFNTIGNIITSVVIPAFSSIGTFVTQTLIPAIGQLFNWLSTNIGPIITSLADSFTSTLLPALSNFGSFVASTVIPMLQSLGEWIGNNIVPFLEKLAAFIASTVIPVLAQVGAFILNTVIPALTQWWSIIATALAPILEKVFNVITSQVLPALAQIGQFITSQVIPALTNAWNFINANIMPILKLFAEYLGGALTTAFNNISTLIGTIWTTITSTIQNAWNIIKGVFDIIVGFITGAFTGNWQQFGNGVGEVWKGITGAIGTAWGTISGVFNTIMGVLSGTFKPAWDLLKTGITAVWNGISEGINTAWSGISSVFNTIVTFLKDTLGGAFTTLETTAKGAWDNISSTVKSAVDNIIKFGGDVIKFFTDLPGNIVNALGNLGSILLNAGKELINGFIHGITSIHIPFPHISVTMHDQSFGPVTVPVPSFDVQWYAKGGIFANPALIGVGDSKSPEAVIPIDMLQKYIVEALNMSKAGNTNTDVKEYRITLDTRNAPNIDEDMLYSIVSKVVADNNDTLGADINYNRLRSVR